MEHATLSDNRNGEQHQAAHPCSELVIRSATLSAARSAAGSARSATRSPGSAARSSRPTEPARRPSPSTEAARSAALSTRSAKSTRSAGSSLSTGAPLTGPWRASLIENLLLSGSENLIKSSLGVFFQGGELLLLGRRELELVNNELRQEVEPRRWSGLSPGSAGKAPRSTWKTAWASGAGTTLRRRTIGVVGRLGLRGNRSRDQNAQRNCESLETLHGELLLSEPWKKRLPYRHMNAEPCVLLQHHARHRLR